MRTSAIFDAKTLDFSKFRTDRGRWEEEERGRANADIFQTREEGLNFSRFCVDVLYWRPLVTIYFCLVA